MSINRSNSQIFCNTFSSKLSFISVALSPKPEPEAPATTPLSPLTKGLETDALPEELRDAMDVEVIVVSGIPLRLFIRPWIRFRSEFSFVISSLKPLDDVDIGTPPLATVFIVDESMKLGEQGDSCKSS